MRLGDNRGQQRIVGLVLLVLLLAGGLLAWRVMSPSPSSTPQARTFGAAAQLPQASAGPVQIILKGELYGKWRNTAPSNRFVLSLNEDGSFTRSDTEGTGSWEFKDTQLTLNNSNGELSVYQVDMGVTSMALESPNERLTLERVE